MANMSKKMEDYAAEHREIMLTRLKIYTSKECTQEFLEKLIPSLDPNYRRKVNDSKHKKD